jgi:hypothetical protein
MISAIGWQEVIVFVAVVIFAVRLYKRRSSSATPKAETANALVPKDESSTNREGPWWFRIVCATVGAIVFALLFEELDPSSEGSFRVLSRIIGAPIGYLVIGPYLWNKFFAQSK